MSEQYLHQYHSSALKNRIFFISLSLVCTFIICFNQIDYILYKVTSILLKIVSPPFVTTQSEGANISEESLSGVSLGVSGFIFTELLEGFWSTLLLSGYGAFLVSLPVIYYHIYKFLLPGLTYLEARFLKSFIILSLSFLVLAHLLTYFVIIPYAASFFLSFQSNYPQTGFISFTGRIYPALTFILNCFTLITFLFQLPLLLFFVFIYFNLGSSLPAPLGGASSRSDPLSISSLDRGEENVLVRINSQRNYTFVRKLLFFSLVFLTAVFSPPDIYSQLFLFIPLFLILESFILMVFIFKESPYSSASIP